MASRKRKAPVATASIQASRAAIGIHGEAPAVETEGNTVNWVENRGNPPADDEVCLRYNAGGRVLNQEGGGSCGDSRWRSWLLGFFSRLAATTRRTRSPIRRHPVVIGVAFQGLHLARLGGEFQLVVAAESLVCCG